MEERKSKCEKECGLRGRDKEKERENRGQILGHSWDKSLKSFPPYYSQSFLLTWFGAGFKPQICELSRLCPGTSRKLYVHEFGFRNDNTGNTGTRFGGGGGGSRKKVVGKNRKHNYDFAK